MTDQMQAVLQKQKAAFTAALPEPMSVRRDRIDRAIALLIDYKDEFAKAVSADFGHRSTEQTLMTDIMPSVSAMKHAKKHFESWAKGERRKPTFPLGLIGAKAEVIYQPKGVVGHDRVSLSLHPELAQQVAIGNPFALATQHRLPFVFAALRHYSCATLLSA